MPDIISRKDSYHDNIFEEILRERAAVLSRAGNAVSDIIDLLKKLEIEIITKQFSLEILIFSNKERDITYEKNILCSEINEVIEKFNATCKRAHLKYYYFIVTREAMGLRRHDRISEIYKIPDEKEKI